MSNTRNGHRPVERDYITILADLITPDTWRDVVRETVELAKKGDSKAREWITRFVLGKNPDSLSALAMKEGLGIQVEDEIVAAAEQALEPLPLDPINSLIGIPTPTESQTHRLLRLMEERKKRSQRTEPTTQNEGDKQQTGD